MKIVKNMQLKIVIFTAVKNRCILHGHVFVMLCTWSFLVSETISASLEIETGMLCRPLQLLSNQKSYFISGIYHD